MPAAVRLARRCDYLVRESALAIALTALRLLESRERLLRPSLRSRQNLHLSRLSALGNARYPLRQTR